jgi:molybdopterin synthase catalytic subunit
VLQSVLKNTVVEITEAPIDVAAILGARRPDSGALITFSGVVRDQNEGRSVLGIHYQCYQAMALREGRRIVEEIVNEFDVRDARLVHRIGDVRVSEISLFVSVASAHRKEAFIAIEALVERVKQRLPIWKKEQYGDDTSAWL